MRARTSGQPEDGQNPQDTGRRHRSESYNSRTDAHRHWPVVRFAGCSRAAGGVVGLFGLVVGRGWGGGGAGGLDLDAGADDQARRSAAAMATLWRTKWSDPATRLPSPFRQMIPGRFDRGLCGRRPVQLSDPEGAIDRLNRSPAICWTCRSLRAPPASVASTASRYGPKRPEDSRGEAPPTSLQRIGETAQAGWSSVSLMIGRSGAIQRLVNQGRPGVIADQGVAARRRPWACTR